MGLDAYVPCDCFARGIAKTPAFAVAVDDGMPWYVRDEDAVAFYAWRETACAHPRFELVSERVSNWAGVRMLQDALRHAGNPLYELLPDANGGSVDAKACAKALADIASFRARFKRITSCLVEGTTGRVFYDYVAAYGGVFLWSRDGHVGFDERGLFVMAPGSEDIAFQARRVAIANGKVRDLDGGATHPCPWKHDVETSYEVVQRVESAGDHHDILATLQKLFGAAVEHDTCVVWC